MPPCGSHGENRTRSITTATRTELASVTYMEMQGYAAYRGSFIISLPSPTCYQFRGFT